MKAEAEGGWTGFGFSLLGRVYDILLEVHKKPVIETAKDKLLASALVQLHLMTILFRARGKVSWGSPELVDNLTNIGKKPSNIFETNMRKHDSVHGRSFSL